MRVISLRVEAPRHARRPSRHALHVDPQRSSDTNITSGSGSTTACYTDDPDNHPVSGGALNLTVREG